MPEVEEATPNTQEYVKEFPLQPLTRSINAIRTGTVRQNPKRFVKDLFLIESYALGQAVGEPNDAEAAPPKPMATQADAFAFLTPKTVAAAVDVDWQTIHADGCGAMEEAITLYRMATPSSDVEVHKVAGGKIPWAQILGYLGKLIPIILPLVLQDGQKS